MEPAAKIKRIPNSRNAKDWQKALTAQLKVLDEICHEHGIRYFLGFGGLLGAVRHRGHIPWDNDVDVVMTEDNYLKLLELEQKGLLPEGYRFVDRNVEEQYPLLFGRFVDTRTSCPLSTSSFNGGIHGLFVDVFLLFPLPNDKAKQEKAVTKFLVWEQLQCYLKRRSNNRTDDFINEWKAITAYQEQHGREAALAKIESEFRALLPSFEEAEWCLHGSGGKYNGFSRLKTADFADVARLPFEDIELDAPADYEGFLEQFYGGSWRLFPQGEKFSSYGGSSLTIPGDVVSRDYMKLIDQEKIDSCFRRVTDLRMTEMIAEHTYRTAQARAMGELYKPIVEEDVDKSIVAEFSDPKRIPLKTRAEAREALDNLTDIYRYQRNDKFAKWHVAIRLTPEVLTAALWSKFLAEEQYWNLKRVMSIHQEDTKRGSFADSPANRMLTETLACCSRLYRAIDERDFETITKCRDRLEANCPASMHAEIAHAFAIVDAGDCLEYIETLPDETRQNDYIRYLEALKRYEAGNEADGKKLFGLLLGSSNNGMLIQFTRDFAKDHGLKLKAIKTPAPESEKDIKGGVGGKRRKKLQWVRFRQFGFKALLPVHKYLTPEVKAQPQIMKQAQKEIDGILPYIEECRNARRLTSDRIAYWESLYPRYSELKNAIEAVDSKSIRTILRGYLNALYRHMDAAENGLYLDKFTFDAARELIIADRGEEFYQKFCACIPESHKLDVADWLRSEGVNHPYLT